MEENGTNVTPTVNMTEEALEEFKNGQPEEGEEAQLTQEEMDALHNKACMDAADKVIRTNQFMNYETIKALMPEPVMVGLVAETMTEAKAADQLARYDFGAMPLFLAKLKELTFLEQVDLYRRVNNEISRWNDCKTALECMEDMRLSDKNNKELMKINTLMHFGVNCSAEDFTKEYNEKMDQLKNIAAVLKACIEAGKEGLGTTSFTTKEMIELMEKRAAEKAIEPNSEKAVAYAKHVIEIFKNRTDFTFLKNRLEIYLKTNKKNLKRAFSEMKGNQVPKCMKTLLKIFGNDTMYRVWYTLIMHHINKDADAVFVFFNFLAKLIETEQKSGNAVWAKVFILNISDCQRGVFDIEDPAAYLGKIWETFHVLIDKFLCDNKINSHIEPGYDYNYQLTTPYHYINALADYEANHCVKLLKVYEDEYERAIREAKEAAAALSAETPTTEDHSSITATVPEDTEEFKNALMEDVVKRAEAAGITIEEVISAISLEQKKALQAELQDPRSKPAFATYAHVGMEIAKEETQTESEETTTPLGRGRTEGLFYCADLEGGEVPEMKMDPMPGSTPYPRMKGETDQEYMRRLELSQKPAKEAITEMMDKMYVEKDPAIRAVVEQARAGNQAERLEGMLIPNP